MGICEMVKNLLMSSSEAVVPARRALVTAAAGLWANRLGSPARPLEQNRRSMKPSRLEPAWA